MGQNGDDVLLDGTLEPLSELRSPAYPLPEVMPGIDRAVGGNGTDSCEAAVIQTCEKSAYALGESE